MRFLSLAAQPRLDHFAEGTLDRAPRNPVRRGDAGAAARGRIRRMAARLTALDAPIFAALKPLLGRLPPDRFPRHDELNALATPSVVSGGGAPIRFVPPAAASGEFSAQYEVRIFETGEVQTRADNWHDLFNALVWLAFPKTKAVLNAHHYEQIKSRLGERLRGTARDVLTLFDEGGIVVAAADPELPALLRQFRWKELFWRRRAEVLRSMRFYVFGHAIYEKALEPYKALQGGDGKGFDRRCRARPARDPTRAAAPGARRARGGLFRGATGPGLDPQPVAAADSRHSRVGAGQRPRGVLRRPCAIPARPVERTCLAEIRESLRKRRHRRLDAVRRGLGMTAAH